MIFIGGRSHGERTKLAFEFVERGYAAEWSAWDPPESATYTTEVYRRLPLAYRDSNGIVERRFVYVPAGWPDDFTPIQVYQMWLLAEEPHSTRKETNQC